MLYTTRLSLFIVVLIVVAVVVVNAGQFEWPAIDRTPNRWIDNAKENIDLLLKRKLNGNIAKNLILFLGDGMGLATITAGRIRKGQMKNKSGEEEITYMESLENVALSKTYNVDAQTADSAGTATAYLCGVKTGVSIIGLNGLANQSQCISTFTTKADSILKWAHKAGKMVGIVTTTRVTHATPAAAFANVPYRDWESYNGKDFTEKEAKEGCSDIAAQLIDENPYINVSFISLVRLVNSFFSHFKVVFGGGRKKFLPNNVKDFANSSLYGDRIDNRNLINEWMGKMKNKSHKFIWNASDFRSTDMRKYNHVMGKFL